MLEFYSLLLHSHYSNNTCGKIGTSLLKYVAIPFSILVQLEYSNDLRYLSLPNFLNGLFLLAQSTTNDKLPHNWPAIDLDIFWYVYLKRASIDA